MRRKLGKRGLEDKLYFLIWEAIAITLVIILIIVSVRGIANNTTYWKKYYSTDMALIADIEHINQGDFVMNYDLGDVNKGTLAKIYFVEDKMFEFVLKKDSIEVYDAPKEDAPYPTTFPYSKSRNIDVLENSVVTDFLVISKIGNSFTLSNFYSDTTENCPSFETKRALNDSTRIDVVALEEPLKIHAESLKNVLSVYGKDKNATTILTIFVASEKSSNFTIYYADDDTLLASQKLACMTKAQYDAKYLDSKVSFAEYDGRYMNNTGFSKYLSDLPSRRANSSVQDAESWIIVNVHDTSKLSEIEFSAFMENVLKKYYE